MRSSAWRTIVGFILAIVSVSAAEVNNGRPGTVTYVVGDAWIGMQPLNEESVGFVGLKDGQTLSTENGAVEVMLALNVFLRIGKNSSAKLLSLNRTNTDIQMKRGKRS